MPIQRLQENEGAGWKAGLCSRAVPKSPQHSGPGAQVGAAGGAPRFGQDAGFSPLGWTMRMQAAGGGCGAEPCLSPSMLGTAVRPLDGQLSGTPWRGTQQGVCPELASPAAGTGRARKQKEEGARWAAGTGMLAGATATAKPREGGARCLWREAGRDLQQASRRIQALSFQELTVAVSGDGEGICKGRGASSAAWTLDSSLSAHQLTHQLPCEVAWGRQEDRFLTSQASACHRGWCWRGLRNALLEALSHLPPA